MFGRSCYGAVLSFLLITPALPQMASRQDAPSSTAPVTRSARPAIKFSGLPQTIISSNRIPTGTNATPESADAIALNNEAVQLSSRSDYVRAAELLRRAIEQAPDRYKFHRNLSVVYEGMKKYDEALVAARRAAELAPSEPSVLKQLCGLQMLTRKDEDAVACYEDLFSFSPADTLNLAYYAVALLHSGRASKAIPILRKVASTQPEAAVFNALGLGYMDEKLYSDAVASFKSAVEADPDQHKLRFNLGVAQLAVGNRQGAISQYRMLKLDDPPLAAKLMKILSLGRVVVVGGKLK